MIIMYCFFYNIGMIFLSKYYDRYDLFYFGTNEKWDRLICHLFCLHLEL